MTKVYSNKSNAQRAAKKFDVAQVVEVEGGWAVQVPSDDEVPAKQLDPQVMLASEDEDFGLVSAAAGTAHAHELADEKQVTIYLRDPVTDEVLGTVEPTPAPEVVLMQLRVYVGADYATALAAKVAKLVGNPVTVHHATSGTQLQVVQPGQAAPAKAAKAPKGERQPRAAKTAPDGMYARIVALCSRDEGATPAELNEMTKWKGAPWKWLLSNPKGTGLADRYGYELIVTKDGRNSIYHLVKDEQAKAA